MLINNFKGGIIIGTDIYLHWKGQTKEEEKKQATGFAIDAGNVGYLRASIGMYNENALLREIFPKKYWEPTKKDLKVIGKKTYSWDKEHKEYDIEIVPYDFKENFPKLKTLLSQYLLYNIEGVRLEHKDAKPQREMGKKIVELLGEAGFDKEQIFISEGGDIETAIMFANSLLQFFWLGMDKQEEKKVVGIYISW